jgi:hypothetical protein
MRSDPLLPATWLLLTGLSALAAANAQQAPAVDADWAFRPLQPGSPPPASAPAWDTHPIDRLVFAGLQQAGLTPNPRAERATLLRRATFVLTGLPPTPEAIDAFVADRADDAWNKAIDRLLASPHYGEHQARAWLDLARYSDSNGLDENLAFGNAFRYRDWVVRAHNDDLPYDRFASLQIAGDLLAGDPAVGLDGYTATGFLALGPRMLAEQDKEKLVLDTVDEQVDLVGRTFLGLTLGCARCHDHKFDPVTQRDYYALAGIFRSTKSFHDLEHVSKWFDRPLADDAAIAARAAAVAARDQAADELRQATDAAMVTMRASLVADTGRYLLAGDALRQQGAYLEAEAADTTSLHADGTQWGDATTTVLHTHRAGDQFASWTVTLPRAGQHQLLVRYAAAQARPMQVQWNGAVVAPAALAATTGGWLPAHQQWHVAATFPATAGRHTLRLSTTAPHVPHLDALLVVPVDAAGDGGLVPPIVAHTAAVLAQPARDPLVGFWRQLVDGPTTSDPAAAAAGFAARAAAMQGQGGLAAILLGGLPPASPRELAARLQTFVATAVAELGAAPRGAPDQGQAREPAGGASSPLLAAAAALVRGKGGLFALPDAQLLPWLPAAERAALAAATEAHERCVAAVPPAPPPVMCVGEDVVRDLPVHYRGNHLTLAAEVTPRGMLSALQSAVSAPALPSHRSGREELARWLFAPGQALPARVHVNRIWQRAFGEGLVRSPSNFGRRGDRPYQVALLDWLAQRLIDQGWSQKQLWRTILTSQTWQQTAACDATQSLRDPEGRWLGRQRRQRLAAESIRDSMLAIAGTLDRSLGGSLLGTGDRDYVTNDQSNDGARYDAPRRSLYLPIIRNAMFDLFAAFDYADPSVHLEQRPRSAVATQALYLLNAPFVHQQSRAFAARAEAAATDEDARILFLWRHALGRAPSPTEAEAARRWLAQCRSAGAVADAWPGLAQTLFASNEFIHVD